MLTGGHYYVKIRGTSVVTPPLEVPSPHVGHHLIAAKALRFLVAHAEEPTYL